MLDSETLRMFNMWVQVCADTVQQLRRCDVQRALEQAANGGERFRFSVWLAEQRPDLAEKIDQENAAIDQDLLQLAEDERSEVIGMARMAGDLDA